MKVRTTKACTINGIPLKAGQVCDFARPIAKNAIDSGLAIQVLRKGETPYRKPQPKKKTKKATDK